MIIDAHTHIFPDNIARGAIKTMQSSSHAAVYCEATESALAEAMESAGIDVSINLPCVTNPLKVRQINERSARRNSRQNKIFNIGGIHPDCADVKDELRRVAGLGLKAVKIHPYFQGYDFDDIEYLRLMEAAGELGLAVVSHVGLDMGFIGQVRATTEMIKNVLRSVGGVKLVLAHMGGCGNWNDIGEVLESSDVYVDSAFSMGSVRRMDGGVTPGTPPLLTAEQFMGIYKCQGADRVMFGTDSPWRDLRHNLDMMAALPLSDAERERVMYKNALELFGLGDWIKN